MSERKYPWYMNAFFYEVHIRAFCDSNGDGIGDIQGLISKLDYIKNLGVDCIWILPIYASPLKDDGYDIADYYKVHSDYGTLEDFKTLVSEAHACGLRIISDLVLNHTSDQHIWFKQARSNPESKYRNFYVWSDSPDKYSGTRIIFLDTEKSNWTFDEKVGKYFWHRFYSSQPDLNYDNPEVIQEMMNVMDFWLDMGLDGFRADAVPYLIEREGTNCENLPETHKILKEFREHLDQNYEGKVLLAEANQWPKDVLPYFGDGDEFHMGFHFPVMPRIFMALRKGDASPIHWIMEQTPDIPRNTQWCTFLRNHDELTLEMVTEEERQWMWSEYAPLPRMRLNLGIRRRLAPLLDNDQRKILLANALLYSLPGTPIIYYGDEIGMGDNIWLPDRNGVRTPMQWNDRENAGFSNTSKDALFAPVIDEGAYTYEKINVNSAEQKSDSLLFKMRHLIQLRKKHPVFSFGDYEFLLKNHKECLVLMRSQENIHILCAMNLTDKKQSICLDLSSYNEKQLFDLIRNKTYAQLDSDPITITLEPFEYFWLELRS